MIIPHSSYTHSQVEGEFIPLIRAAQRQVTPHAQAGKGKAIGMHSCYAIHTHNQVDEEVIPAAQGRVTLHTQPRERKSYTGSQLLHYTPIQIEKGTNTYIKNVKKRKYHIQSGHISLCHHAVHADTCRLFHVSFSAFTSWTRVGK